METLLFDLMQNGFMIFPSNGRFVVRKEAVPSNMRVIESQEVSTYEEAIELAKEMHLAPQQLVWTCVARYNRGLGVEYRVLPDVFAATIEEARAFAQAETARVFDKKTVVSEIRVRVKNSP
jgi:hypothetical protein